MTNKLIAPDAQVGVALASQMEILENYGAIKQSRGKIKWVGK